jgi:cell division protein FtsA
MSKGQKIAALDIGSSKVVCIIAEKNGDNKIKVSGIGHQLSEGIKSSIITDVKKAERSILAAINAAEKMAGETIEEIYCNVSGCNILSQHVSIESRISGHAVTNRDIDNIIKKGVEALDKRDSEILNRFALGYKIDDNEGIKNPVGMFGESLSTNLHFVTASQTAIKNLRGALAKCQLNVVDFIFSGQASGVSTLRDDEKEIGVTLIDIGAATTTIAVFAEGFPIYFDYVPIGGAHITKDVALGLAISPNFAERLKILHGSCIKTDSDDRDVLDIKEDDDNLLEERSITRAELINIIQPRTEEIFELINEKLLSSGVNSLAGTKAVLTGGSSQLQGIKEVADHMLSKNSRVAKPIELHNIAESAKGPAFATVAGMLMMAFEKLEEKQNLLKTIASKAESKSSNSIIQWFKRNF